MKTNSQFFSRFQKSNKSTFFKKHRQQVGGVIFVIGFVLSLGFNSLAVIGDLTGFGFWGDTNDALAYDNTQPAPAKLAGIQCPILLAPGAEGTITATFQNPYQEKVDILVKVVVSQYDYLTYRVITTNLEIEPGGKQIFRWQVSGQDIIESNLILSRVFLMNRDQLIPFPVRTDSCGLFVWDIWGMKGTTVVILLFISALACLIAGSILLYQKGSAIQKTSPRIDHGLYSLAGFSILAMICNLLGKWVFGGLLLVLALLFGTIIIASLFNFEKNR